MSETEVTTEVQFENSDDLDAFSEGFFGQKPADTTPTKVEAEQEQESQEQVETQAQDEDEQDEAELKQEIDEKPKRKTVQDRIDEVVRQREELRRESERQLAELRKEIEALKKGPAQAQPAQAAEEPKHDAVKDDGSPVYPLGEFDPQYIRDLTRHTLSQERQRMEAEMAESQRQAAVQQEQQALQSTWNAKVEEATKQYPDLQEKGRAMLANFENLDPAYAGYLSQVIMQMDKGPDVLYYLSNHPEEAISIVNSGAQKATLALGRIESRFLQSEQEAPKPKVTKAPAPPPARVQARGTNGAFISVAPDTDDLEAFEAEFFKPQKY
jgi:hypothetical protein